uniref:Uncharacterized protein n=1 Tax=Arion vulgaris TaxID=1028688 RepID=A0A0B6ZFX2_9EUPU
MSHGTVTSQSKRADNIFELEHDKQEECVQYRWWQKNYISSVWRKKDPKKKRKALVRKNGTYRMFVIGLGEHKSKFFSDIYITVIDLRWPYLIAILFIIYLVIFISFAVFWWLMAYNNGDFDNLKNSEHEFCLRGVKSFRDAVMFSMETQTTIGYGFAYPNAHCVFTVPLTFLQVVIGLFLETLMLGSIFVKIAQPKNRARTILFSNHAVVNQENGKLVLQVRVGDLRRSHLVDSSISGMMIDSYSTKEGSSYPLYQFNCEFSCGKMANQMFLMFPVIVKHVIDENSPLYSIDPENLMSQKFEIVLYLTGTVESTGEMCQARTSYLSNEILWGYRFARMEEFNTKQGQWHVDFKGFNNVVRCHDESHSARELDARRSILEPSHSADIHNKQTFRTESLHNVTHSMTSNVIQTAPSSEQTDETESIV